MLKMHEKWTLLMNHFFPSLFILYKVKITYYNLIVAYQWI